MIRAAALSYAIVFSLLVGLICSGVIFISATQKKIEVLQTNKEHVLFDSYAAIRYGMFVVPPGDSVQYIHSSGDTSEVKHQQWGAFSMICTTTHKSPLNKRRAALVGMIQAPELPCLYLPGNSGGLKITGETKVEGKAFVPNGNVERAYIAGKNYPFDQLIFGSTEVAELGLPPLKKEWQNLLPADLVGATKPQRFIAKDSTYGFHNGITYFQQLEPIVITQAIRGNAIIHSFDSIFVSAKAQLTNVILMAPVVRFETGFTGSVQVLASERVICEKEVQLLYPSVIALNEQPLHNELTRRIIILEENAQVLGGILITSQSPDFRKLPFLELHKESVVGGLIYNSGETEAKGTIIGSLYTFQLSVRAGGGSYGNHLVDAIISQKRLPDYFLLPGWLQAQERVQSKLITWL
ncbi:MAG: hypothetical protein A3D31_01195 [Candidatus Fluviicola riflensis]|nr:MAG: hypothetical protein CHH17_04345 [Candidatus Fluviicola riflensis]OGS76222.1 MAG: hypothetical protein A3D31_01195 [Candidatus Fluviicola riflensis]OGS83234.1 MAG: hypothetical protein A2724_00645 [Fluviicola sp. RIFCSPHIGHO2_01_FULL_43_53]OGS83754.1 MAG: hypothetical protein A3E30_17800 [Fluviicola sp. RIFCSPHIGHO2_12_FULL_43_24]